MPTRMDATTVKIIDRSGDGLSRNSATVKFVFKRTDGGHDVIAAVQILEGADTGASPLDLESLKADFAPWRQYGSTDVGQGAVTVNNVSAGDHIFLITKLKPEAVKDPEFCVATELVIAKELKDFEKDELVLLARRLNKLVLNQPGTGGLDCTPPITPG